jgi:hypothetical protein
MIHDSTWIVGMIGVRKIRRVRFKTSGQAQGTMSTSSTPSNQLLSQIFHSIYTDAIICQNLPRYYYNGQT